MIFVRQREEHRDNQNDDGPLEPRFLFAECPHQEKGEDRVFGQMRSFPNEEMDLFYSRQGNIRLEPVQERRQKSRGVFR